MRNQELILAELEAAQKEYDRAKAEFTESLRGQIDPDQEIALNPSDEMLDARDRLENAQLWLERLQEEYEFFLLNKTGVQD